jgi:hypothetical protein
MELEEDYGDITHKHTHLHFQPEPYKKTIDTALKDWCMEIFDEEGEEKCKELNQSFFNDLLTGSTDEIDMSKIYMYLSQLPLLTGEYNGNTINIENTEIIYKTSENIYREEIKYRLDLAEQELFAIFYLKKDDFTSDKRILKITLGSNGFLIDSSVYEYNSPSNNLITNLKTELRKINLNQLMLENEETMEDINEQKEKINKRKISKPDVITGKRRLDNLEKWDEDILKELFGLTTYLIIGISFGIYCIYNFFVLELK